MAWRVRKSSSRRRHFTFVCQCKQDGRLQPLGRVGPPGSFGSLRTVTCQS